MAVGYVYPAYECYKIVERPMPDLEHLRFWCQYWMIIAVVTVIERLADIVVSWVPMYSEAKLAFIIYLWYPKTMGTTYVYSTLLRPFVVQYESEIDHNLNEVRTRAGDIALLWWQKGSMYAQARFYELLQFLASQSNKVQQNPSGAPSRTPAQGLSRGLPQGVPQSYPPPGASGSETAPYPPQEAQAGQGQYPPPPSSSAGAHIRRQSGSRGVPVGDSDHGVVEKHSEKRTSYRLEDRSGTSVGGQNPPPRVQNTKTRPQTDSPWSISAWIPSLLGTTPSKKVD